MTPAGDWYGGRFQYKDHDQNSSNPTGDAAFRTPLHPQDQNREPSCENQNDLAPGIMECARRCSASRPSSRRVRSLASSQRFPVIDPSAPARV